MWPAPGVAPKRRQARQSPRRPPVGARGADPGATKLPLRGGSGRTGEERAPVDDGVGDVCELPVSAAGVSSEQLEGCAFVDVVALHEDAFGAFDRRRRANAPSRLWNSAKRSRTMSIELCSCSASPL